MFNITTKLIIFFLISFSNVHASCFGNIINSDISKIEFVEIENKNKFFSTIGKFYLIKKKDS